MKKAFYSRTKLISLVGVQFLLLATYLSREVFGCHENQLCLTPRNRIGTYLTRATYLTLSEKYQNLCLGICNYNKTTELICCATQDVPADKRISQVQCEYDHRDLGFIFIVHGTVARANEFPFMAAIGWRTFDNAISYQCGGTLISNRYLLTAAHCLYHSSEPPVVVRPGGFDLDDAGAKDIAIDQIYVHPGYEFPGIYNDIAIISLQQGYFAESQGNTGPACVWAQPLYAANVTAIGYGNTQFAGLSSPKLLKANLTILSNQQCAQYYVEDTDSLNHGIIYSQICANDEIKLRDTCQGDSGGPIIMYRNLGKGYYEAPYIVGITSFGIGCGTGTPGIYTRVASYIDWIEKIVFY
ncbi:serine protease snake-like isoform X1 [Rhagoletis pomonella]|uniref:serine protease snake-like isoform X1 n=1 Tax=Rhagoletis pomonella TaxID=28610 RepID=UPI00177C6E95|nr:serine protease snake-like isoform X1 [Rhagoletis pomonella]